MSQSQPIYTVQGEQQLMVELWDPRLADNPAEFVRFVYPWGKENTPLADIKGPHAWQDDVLEEIAAYIKAAQDHRRIHHAVPEMYKSAVASGRGIGKSALFAWLAHWLASTRLGCSVWVTANGEPQLKTKTFPEIAKWVTLSINSHWFDVAATKIEPAQWIKEAVQRDMRIDPKYWYIVAQLWAHENPDAFAGAHNTYGEMYLFDEASGVPPPIWTVAQGVFTEQIVDRYWLAFSNPRRNNGTFFECFHKDRARWRTRNIDARTVDIAPDVWQAILDKHGPDSDEARVEVFGQFPNQSLNQFINRQAVGNACEREVVSDPGAPLLMGVDVARFGEDESVIAFRKGRDARTIPWQCYRGIDTVQLSAHVADAALRYKVDAVFVDGNGVGGGVVDLLRSWGHRIIEVQSGATPIEPDKYLNKRVEMWALMREWLTIGAIPLDRILQEDLAGPEYSFHPVNSKLVLENKEHMRDRSLASPDRAEALAMTFAQPVARRDTRTSRAHSRIREATGMDYEVLS